jgi:hypothetical protein
MDTPSRLPHQRRGFDADTVEGWRQAFTHYVEAGASRWRAYAQVAGDHGVGTTTVACHLDPAIRNRYRLASRRYYAQPDNAARRAARQQERNRRPEVREYQLWYHRLFRRPERNGLGWIFGDHEEHSVTEVRQALREYTGVDFGPGTISAFVQRYIEGGRGPPYVEEIEPGVYRAKPGPHGP